MSLKTFHFRSEWVLLALICFLISTTFAGDEPAALNPDSSVDQILDALHDAGKSLKDFSADVSMTETDSFSGEASVLSGKVAFQARDGGDSRIRVTFDKKVEDDHAIKGYKQEYLLDKGWLIDRNYKSKIEIQRQVLKPGQKMNILKLGEGPFPLPIGQERADALANFEVKKIDTKAGDPATTVHILLTPKANSPSGLHKKFKTIDLYVDAKTGFPKRIETDNKVDKNIHTTDLANVRLNVNLTNKDFELEKVEGWTLKTESLE